MVINDKALVREMKEAYKGWGYTVMVMDGDKWVISSKDNNWIVTIDGQNNVPNEVLALIVLHMGELPKWQTCHRIYKLDKSICVQKEVYKVAAKDQEALEKMALEADPQEVRRTALVYGRRRVWQNLENRQILLINPQYEGLMDIGPESMIRAVGGQIYLEGEISCVYISRARGGANEELLEHLAQVSWT